MNCRIPRIIESLNASCARGLTEGISARASPRHPPIHSLSLSSFSLKLKLKGEEGGLSESGHPNEAPTTRMGGGGQLGWLKWREFGRRGDTARDQVIQVFLELNVCWLCPPVGSRIPKQVPPRRGRNNVTQQTSDQKRLPAEFKHITKRRRRN